MKERRSVVSQMMAPRTDWSDMGSSEHFVQFYETDDFLLEALRGFIGSALEAGGAGIVAATADHRSSLEERLREGGLDVSVLAASGQYVPLDAADVLGEIMGGDRPDAGRFAQVVGGYIARAAERWSYVRVFGEMVALLWIEGRQSAAVELEELWNELHRAHSFSLFCGYPADAFGGEAGVEQLSEVCAMHSRVIPAESYSGLASAGDRLRAIVLLQQKAHSLEREIAERKEVEAALRASAESFRLMAESMPQKIFTAKPNGDVDYFNPQWTEFTGLPFEEIRDWGWTQFIHPDDVEENVRRWRHSLATGEPFELEHRFRRADGTYRWHLSRARALRDASGKVLMWIGSNTDIDDQKRAEIERDRARAEAETMLGQIADGVIVIDNTGRTTYLNEAAKALLGVDTTGVPAERRSDVYGMLTVDGDPFGPEELPSMRAMREKRAITGFDMRIRRPDGTEIPVQENAAPIMAEDGSVAGAVATLRDVSAQRKLEHQKEDFLSAVAHDLKNPITVLQGQAQLLRRRAQRGSLDQGQIMEGLELIEGRARVMTGLIDELMDVTRMRMGQGVQLNLQCIDLVELVRQAVAAEQSLVEDRRLGFESAVGELVGFWDGTRLTRVLSNLLDNAVKYSPEGSEVRVGLKREEHSGRPWAVVTVRDQGLGIPARELPHIFDWFYRAENVADAMSGTGIGLAGARQIVEEHGGTTAVESQEGVGSTFTIRLPVSQSDETRAGSAGS